MCNDAHFLYTGYAKYGNEVLSRLQDTGKYHLAELACYGHVNDDRCTGSWRYYANAVKEGHPQHKFYQSSPVHEFGSWRFDRTCLDFRPDIVWDIRDPWMLSYEHNSAFRKFYHWAIMPTVDSHPQRVDWIDMFCGADTVMSYSNYGKRVLENESAGRISVKNVAPPGCDIDTFKPMNKKAIRNLVGLDSDINILGTVMRNQIRKLYPDLFKMFRKFIDICYETGNKELAEKTFLYAHTSYPDSGWEIPKLIKEYELGKKVIFTYVCNNCKSFECNFFRGARNVCSNCGGLDLSFPNTLRGLNSQQLAQVYNIFDAYIQYAVCEGFGMPQVEATSCGLPVLTVDYSAMQDIVENCGATALPVKRMFRDHGTSAWRALPDNDESARIVFDFFNKPVELRNIIGKRARRATEEIYNWDRTAKIWEDHFDSVEIQDGWNKPEKQYRTIPTEMPEEIKNGSNAQFVSWCISEVLQEPEKNNSRVVLQMINDLNFGARKVGRQNVRYDRQKAMEDTIKSAENKQKMEGVRVGKLELEPQDYITFANQREEYLS